MYGESETEMFLRMSPPSGHPGSEIMKIPLNFSYVCLYSFERVEKCNLVKSRVLHQDVSTLWVY